MQPADASTSTIEPRALGSTRRSASVARSAPDARTASPITSRLRKPPVPMISREPNSRPAIVNVPGTASATLPRLYDLHPRAFLERHVVPSAARHHLAVECDRHATALARRAAGCHGLAHGGAVAEVAPLAVEDDLHARAPVNLPAPNGSTASGG